MKELCIVEFPSNLGLKEPQPGKEPGVKNLPDWLWKHNLHKALNPKKIIRLDPPKYTNSRDPETNVLNTDSLVEYAREQAYLINNLLTQNKFPFVLGGDCSILLGPAIALKQKGNYGLFYLDGHTDFMDISLSETGGVGGMAASIVTGNGHQKLTNILNLSPYIKEENLWCVGIANTTKNTKMRFGILPPLTSAFMNCGNKAFQTPYNLSFQQLKTKISTASGCTSM